MNEEELREFNTEVIRLFASIGVFKLSDEDLRQLKDHQESERWRTDPLGLMPYLTAFTDGPRMLYGLADFLRGISAVIDNIAYWLDMIASIDD